MNRITLLRTGFVDLEPDYSPFSKIELDTFGWRIFDDFEQAYSNGLSAQDMQLSDADFLKKVHESSGDPQVCDMITWAINHGIYIGDQWYEAEWVQKVLPEEEPNES